MKGKLLSFFLIATIGILWVGCADDSPTDVDGDNVLLMSFENVPPLQNGLHYEGWAIINGEAISTGKFNVDTTGNLLDLDGAIIPNSEFEITEEIAGASAIVLTIEPANDSDPAPAATHLVAGDVADGNADLTIGHAGALGTDFSTAQGSYILATPSNGDTTNETSGIWFLDPAGPDSSLVLPTLPDGWAYEGWAVINGTPVTSGKFVSPTGADSSAPYSGTQPTPGFPGEDYLVNAPMNLTFPTDLSGGKVVVSVEPSPDDSPAPFVLKPLAGDIPAPASDHTSYPLANNAMNLPSGTATIK